MSLPLPGGAKIQKVIEELNALGIRVTALEQKAAASASEITSIKSRLSSLETADEVIRTRISVLEAKVALLTPCPDENPPTPEDPPPPDEPDPPEEPAEIHLVATPTQLDFTSTFGAATPAAKTIVLTVNGEGTLVDPQVVSTTDPSGIIHSVVITQVIAGVKWNAVVTPVSGKPAGSYSASVTLRSADQTNPDVIVAVTHIVAAAPSVPLTLVLSSTSLPISIDENTDAGVQNVTLSQGGDGALTTPTAGAPSQAWITGVVITGSWPSWNAQLTFNTDALAVGVHTATVAFSSANATNNPRTLTVTLTVSAVAAPSVFPYGAAALPNGMLWDYDENGVKTVTGSPLSFSHMSVPTITGVTRDVASVSDWNTNLALSVAGDALRITADFSGSITYNKQLASGFIHLITDRLAALDAARPYNGDYMAASVANRIARTDTTCFRTITATGVNTSAIKFGQGAAGLWVRGVKFLAGSVQNEGVIDIGTAIITQESHFPNRIAFDRCIGDAAEKMKRAFNLNGKDILVCGSLGINATSSAPGQGFSDSQGMACWRGGKQMLLFNNESVGESECLAFGGTGGGAPFAGFVAGTDCAVIRNFVTKPSSWDSDTSYPLKKNMVEWKSANRFLYLGNHHKGYKSSPGGQYHQVVIKCETDPNETWKVTQDLTIIGNYYEDGTEGGCYNISAQGSNSYPHGPMARITIVNEYFKHQGTDTQSSIQILTSSGAGQQTKIDDLHIEHITVGCRDTLVKFGIPQASQWSNFVLRNIASFVQCTYGPILVNSPPNYNKNALNNAMGAGNWMVEKLAKVTGGATFATNGSLLAAPHNCIEDTAANMFTNPGAADYSAKAGGPLEGTATDGFDIGANKTWIDTLVAGLV